MILYVVLNISAVLFFLSYSWKFCTKCKHVIKHSVSGFNVGFLNFFFFKKWTDRFIKKFLCCVNRQVKHFVDNQHMNWKFMTWLCALTTLHSTLTKGYGTEGRTIIFFGGKDEKSWQKLQKQKSPSKLFADMKKNCLQEDATKKKCFQRQR